MRGASRRSRWDLKFGFHDHDTEFKEFDGVTGFDLLMQYTDPKVVQWQMDCYWVTQAGRDPVELFKKYGARMQSLHLKDRKPNAPTSTDTGPGSQHFAEVGMGTLDWPRHSAARGAIPRSQHVRGAGCD